MSCTPFVVLATGKVPLTTAAVGATDTYRNGLRVNADETAVLASTSGGDEVSNGLLLTANGQVVYVDATSGLPANTEYINGLPISPSGALCVSTDAAATYSNGTPMTANGAVAVSLLGAALLIDGFSILVDGAPILFS